MKKIITFVLCAALCLSLAGGAFASGEASEANGRSIRVIVIGRRAEADVPAGETTAEEASGEAGGDLPLEAVDVLEFGGEEYVRLDDLIISLLLGNR